MASLFIRKTRGNTFWGIKFYDKDGRQKMISLSQKKYKEKTAKELKDVIEALIHRRSNSEIVPDKKIDAWIQSADPEIRKKLANVGLIEFVPNHTCKELWEAFLKSKKEIKPSTMETYLHCQKRFYLFFKENDSVGKITQQQMLQWKSFLLERLENPTVAGTIKNLKSVFNWAKLQGWITKSPLEGVSTGSFQNPSKDYHVTREQYLKLLECCPCQEWRTILACVRYGGLRCPSEVLQLRWSDIDWEGCRFYVRSPKTEHHQGKEGRIVPLFQEVRKELTNLFAQKSNKEDDYVFHRYQDRSSSNLRTQFKRVCKMAGLKPFNRPFDNMRASRSMEIYVEFGEFFESEWIGHSYNVAKKHYLKIRDIDYHRVADREESTPEEPDSAKNDEQKGGETTGSTE